MGSERAPRPGVTWESVLVRREVVVDDGEVPRLNRVTRRALAREQRKAAR